MATRHERTRIAPVTVGAAIRNDYGINLHCKCGHRTSLPPAQLVALAPPETPMLDFKRRFRCSMCGRRGATGGITLTFFPVAEAFAARADNRETPVRKPQ